MKKSLIIFALTLLLFPILVFATSKDYEDKVAPIANVEVEEGKVNLYLFHSADCSHCAQERKWLEDIKEDYKDYLNVYEYEVTYNEQNQRLFLKVTNSLNIPNQTVPVTIIGDKHYIGFSESKSSMIEESIK